MDILFKAWPIWLNNLGIAATLIGTFITFFVFYQTRSLTKTFNQKVSSDYLVSTISSIYQRFTEEIIKARKSSFSEDQDLKILLWKIIHECDGCAKVFKKHDKEIYLHVNTFRIETEILIKNLNNANNLTYDRSWNYYGALTKLHEAIKSEYDMRTRKV
ncbi:hypothetical protein WKH24_10985 [Pantoea agglomerans]|uniref:hypothetical protein n=1 Tax=Enterobacter agglomerans TaxID=549 RepID=UPI003C7DDEE9